MSRLTQVKPDQLPEGTIPAGEQDMIVVLQEDGSGKRRFKRLPPKAFEGKAAPQVRFQYSVDGVSDWTDVFNNTHVFLRTSVDDGNTWSDVMRFRGLDGAVLSVNGRIGNVDGLVENNDARLRNNYVMHERWVDATGLDENTYYPVIFNLNNGINTRIELDVNLDIDNGNPSWATHSAGFTTKVIWENHGAQWGGAAQPIRRVYISRHSWASVTPVGDLGQLINSSSEYIFVRGGGRYRFFVSQEGVVPELHPNGFEMHGQRVDPQGSVEFPVVNTMLPYGGNSNNFLRGDNTWQQIEERGTWSPMSEIDRIEFRDTRFVRVGNLCHVQGAFRLNIPQVTRWRLIATLPFAQRLLASISFAGISEQDPSLVISLGLFRESQGLTSEINMPVNSWIYFVFTYEIAQ